LYSEVDRVIGAAAAWLGGMTLLDSLLSRLGYAKLSKFGLALAPSGRVRSVHRTLHDDGGGGPIVGWSPDDNEAAQLPVWSSQPALPAPAAIEPDEWEYAITHARMKIAAMPALTTAQIAASAESAQAVVPEPAAPAASAAPRAELPPPRRKTLPPPRPIPHVPRLAPDAPPATPPHRTAKGTPAGVPSITSAESRKTN
jgi:hypothetical protein